jgi:enoyl-CoA hydratase/carnithine racemase
MQARPLPVNLGFLRFLSRYKKLLFLIIILVFSPAERLYAMGAINRLYPRDELVDQALAFAAEIAQFDPLPLRQAKRAVNTTMDIMGQHYIANRFAELLDEAPQMRLRPE